MVDKITNPPSQKDLIDKVNEIIDDKQDTLVSGTNIKTINNTSILGSGNIEVGGGYTAGTGIDITNDVISVTSDISTGATLGATAVQLADLASVATSGSYNDLSNKPDLNGKADIDLSNITSIGKNIANWSTNVTNCITEIPQDIKLELNNGTLTLKAGSKVYMPNGKNADGSNIFNEIIIKNDINYRVGYNDTRMLFVQGSNHSEMDGFPVSKCYSGDTAPTSTTYMYWYDIANNIIKRTVDGGSTWDSNDYSLPICIVYGNNGVVTSINQVFNGFGYIGSTVFALPDVKGLIPNGRNADGTLNNIEFTTENVLTYTNTNNLPYTWVLQFNSANISVVNAPNYIESDNEPTNILGWTVWFNTRDNINYLKNIGAEGASWVREDLCNNQVKITTNSSNGITSFSPKTAFHAVDYNDVVLKQNFQVVSVLPANPDANTFYFIPE